MGIEHWTWGREPWALALSLSLAETNFSKIASPSWVSVSACLKKKKKDELKTAFDLCSLMSVLKTGNFKNHSARWGKSFSLTKLVTINKIFDLSLDPLFHHQIVSFLPQCQKAHNCGSKRQS